MTYLASDLGNHLQAYPHVLARQSGLQDCAEFLLLVSKEERSRARRIAALSDPSAPIQGIARHQG